ncbi:P-loop containing nucleoside triphosphate hydrolase protein [Kalaharituber pfeilii]|nr:P-loop containing nucleoside triphosphate hydrolase protein [Kalaharituber pfeilii]
MAKEKGPKPKAASELPVRQKQLLNPKPAPKQKAEDFILTISDTEDNVPVLDEDEDEALVEAKAQAAQKTPSPSPEPEPQTGTKRKRKSGTKQKKPKKARLVGNEGAHGSDSEEMNSDFEFQTGENDGMSLAAGGFEGWGVADGAKAGLNGEKKAVDIDEIIRRRRHKRGEDVNGGVAGIDDVLRTSGKEDKKTKKTAKEEEQDEWASSESEEAEEEDDIPDMSIASDDEDIAADGFGGGAGSDEEDEDENIKDENESGLEDDDGDDDDDDDSQASIVEHPLDNAPSDGDSDASSAPEDYEDAARKSAFFAPESESVGSASKKVDPNASFQSMNLSRPILRGLNSVGFTTPTLIQSKTIPFALLGKDIVAGAVTGSGKTAAFVVPILERLLYRPKKIPTTRVLVLCPTRELAIQCHSVATKLAAYTDITFALAVGGLNLKTQEAALKARPDVVIATPGRFIDLIRNTAGVAVDSIEILVVDEADRMLEDGFADELNEIISNIPRSRQTMLFSATMTDSVDQLVRLSLNRPVRLMIDTKNATVSTLIQEFIRIRPQREHLRLAMLIELVTTVYRTRTIIFFRSKSLAHRVRILFSLLNLKAAELHGSLTQEQRVAAIDQFRTSAVDFLLATDLASRGLDIKNIDFVLNYDPPHSHEIYLHRVGRTARAGRSGRACTLAAESERKIVKAAVKAAKAQNAPIAARVLDPARVDAWGEKLTKLEPEIDEILKEEKDQKQLSQADMELRKGENMIKYADEIASRPQRSWFQSQADKKKTAEAMRTKLAEATGKAKGEKIKLSGKKKRKLDGERDRVEGRVYKKTKVERMEGQKRGSGVKALMKKVKAKKTAERAKSKAIKRKGPKGKAGKK